MHKSKPRIRIINHRAPARDAVRAKSGEVDRLIDQAARDVTARAKQLYRAINELAGYGSDGDAALDRARIRLQQAVDV